jgi:hypothetical protein
VPNLWLDEALFIIALLPLAIFVPRRTATAHSAYHVLLHVWTGVLGLATSPCGRLGRPRCRDLSPAGAAAPVVRDHGGVAATS